MALIEHPSNNICDSVIGASIEVHRSLGAGLLESSYQACLAHELSLRGIPHSCCVPVPLIYKGLKHQQAYIADIVIDDRVVLEIKSVDKLKPVHINQLITYMRLLHVTAGLLINFNTPKLADGIRRRLL